jgi:hypothetical protein
MTSPTLQPGQRVHHWQIVSVNGRRVVAQCRCREIRTITLDSLLSGECSSCGCSTPTEQKVKAIREAKEEMSRRRDLDWRIIGRGR